MKKLTLALEDLRIDSFDTTPAAREKGTVVGQQYYTLYETHCPSFCLEYGGGGTCAGLPTCAATCAQTCPQTCDDLTCAETCGRSCYGTCEYTCRCQRYTEP